MGWGRDEDGNSGRELRVNAYRNQGSDGQKQTKKRKELE